MNHFLYIVLAAGLIALGFVYGLPYLQQPSAERLVQQALNASTEAEQVDAARELAKLEKASVAGFRQLLNQSDNADVVAVSILGLSRQMDYECMDQILNKLDNSSITVRSAAANAAANLLGRNHHFPVDGTVAQRNRIKERILADWEHYQGSELFEFNQQRYQQ